MRKFFYKRSIYISKDIKEGEVFSQQNLRIIRPGDGLEPGYYNMLIGKKANKNLKAGTPLTWTALLST